MPNFAEKVIYLCDINMCRLVQILEINTKFGSFCR